jgi:uncharacterized protein (DUF302 family)
MPICFAEIAKEFEMTQTATENTRYGMARTIDATYEDAIARVTELLKEQGFGVLTEIDVKATLKKKIDKDVAPYAILGACNPRLAARALELEPDIGLLLPCNVIVAQQPGGTRVGIINPQSMVEFTDNPALAEVSREADARLRRVMDAL